MNRNQNSAWIGGAEVKPPMTACEAPSVPRLFSQLAEVDGLISEIENWHGRLWQAYSRVADPRPIPAGECNKVANECISSGTVEGRLGDVLRRLQKIASDGNQLASNFENMI